LCSGYYRYDKGFEPAFEGADRFRGRIVHPQHWPEDLDYAGKRIVVIGSGATAVTMVPALAPQAAHVTMLQRSPSYIFTRPARDKLSHMLRKILPARLADAAIRWKDIGYVTFTYQLARRRPEWMREVVRRSARRQLGKGFDMGAHFSPAYAPWDQRLCVVPDGDLFAALRRGDASIVTGEIETLRPEGVRLKSGEVLAADLIVTATGLSIKLLGGAHVTMDGQSIPVAERMVYRGCMIEGVPNFAFTVGYTNAAWTLRSDLSARLVSRILNHMRRHAYAVVTPVPREPAAQTRPLFEMSSGYLQRAAGFMPRQGDKPPWKVRQNYIADFVSFLVARLDDGELRFERH
jgi:monooxygenase